MTKYSEIEQFLSEFHTKLDIFDIYFVDYREKNTLALAELNIVPGTRKTIIQELSAKDYVKGPENDIGFVEREIWVFGKTVKKKEVYIKISMGRENSNVICISFHIAEKAMSYPFQNIV
jgi:hypothetical protein